VAPRGASAQRVVASPADRRASPDREAMGQPPALSGRAPDAPSPVMSEMTLDRGGDAGGGRSSEPQQDAQDEDPPHHSQTRRRRRTAANRWPIWLLVTVDVSMRQQQQHEQPSQHGRTENQRAVMIARTVSHRTGPAARAVVDRRWRLGLATSATSARRNDSRAAASLRAARREATEALQNPARGSHHIDEQSAAGSTGWDMTPFERSQLDADRG